MVNFIHYRKRKKKKLRPVLILIIILLIGWFYYTYTLNTPIKSQDPASSYIETQTFIVQPGWGSAKISKELKSAGLIRSAYIFQLHAWGHGIDSKLQIGEYALAVTSSIKEVAQILSRGSGQTKEVTLTFIEGWSNEDFAKYLSDQKIANSQDFYDIVKKKQAWWDDYRILDSKPRNLDLEGYLFPDTYRIFRDASLPDIVKKMLNNMENKITQDMRAEIKRQGKTIHEILTMASILEKEVKSDEERRHVADIFYKRLKVGIALQADSTVNYATGKSVARASASDLNVDSLYNTYRHRGLPPGPIAHPSLSSINAAIYPASNSYFYFLTTPDGEVVYNETFKEHVEDKNRYY